MRIIFQGNIPCRGIMMPVMFHGLQSNLWPAGLVSMAQPRSKQIGLWVQQHAARVTGLAPGARYAVLTPQAAEPRKEANGAYAAAEPAQAGAGGGSGGSQGNGGLLDSMHADTCSPASTASLDNPIWKDKYWEN
jgi:hypothetical protein